MQKKNLAAVALGRRGGKVGGKSTSEAKREAVRANGAKGGRPAALTPGLHLVPTGKYMHINTGSVDTGAGWEADYQAAVKSGETEGWEDTGDLHRVRKTKTAAEREEHGEWMPYDRPQSLT